MEVSIVPFHKRTFGVSPLTVGRITHQEIQRPGVPTLPPGITTSGPLFGENLGPIEVVTHPVPIGHTVIGEEVTNDGGASSPCLGPARHTEYPPDPPDPPIAVGPGERALQRLINPAVPQDELDVDEADGQSAWDGANSENSSTAGDSCESERLLCLPSLSCLMLIYHTSLQSPPHSFFLVGRLDFLANEYYVNDANMRELLRLRKNVLVQLRTPAGLSEDFDALTKHELADAIISARDDVVDLPPRAKAERTISLEQVDKGQFDTGLDNPVVEYSSIGVR